MTTLHFRADRSGAVLVVAVAGVLHLHTRAWLADFVEGVLHGDARVVVDFDEVYLCDASSMTTLIRIAATCRDRGGWLRLARVNGMAARNFAIVAFGREVPIYTTTAAAIDGDESARVKD